MKKIIKLTYILLILLMFQCASVSRGDDWCKKIKQKSFDYIFNFQMKGDSAYLDSALVLVDSALVKCKDQKLLFSFRKIDVLSKKRDFSEAIWFVKSLDSTLYPGLPYYNDYLINRFNAMSYQIKGDLGNRDKYLKIIIAEVQKFISLDEGKVDSLYHTKDFNEILRNPLHISIIQYYYAKSILQGYDSVKLELDSLQSIKNINLDYFNHINDILKEDLLNYNIY